MPNANDTLAAQFVEAWNSHDLTCILSFYASDYEGTDMGSTTPQCGAEGVVLMFRQYLAAFPDLSFTTQDVTAHNHHLTLTWIARGTHLSPFMGVPPTGHGIEVRGVTVLDLEGGKIRRASYLWDLAALMSQIDG